jgi:hypothetical protein
MARLTTPGIWLPGPLNTINSSSPTAQADIAGNPFFMGLNPGKLVVLATNEAQNVAAPGSTLYDGAYQYVNLDSGATAAYATEGMAAFILLDQGGPIEGALPETAYGAPTVTTADVAEALYGSVAAANAFFCGVFINPATVAGQENGPTPGNWTMIFAGAGRATVNVGSVANVALGNAVFPDTNHLGKFEGAADFPATPGKVGIAVSPGTSGNTAVAYYPDIILRFVS